MDTKNLGLRPVHPFPARMAAEIAFDSLKHRRKSLRVLDPMVGSGTTIAIATRRGHKADGFDTDPLAILIANVWCSRVDKEEMLGFGKKILERAKAKIENISLSNSYPHGCLDNESKAFIRYWFDAPNRIQLCALSSVIRRVHNEEKRNILWCAFSRLIIRKSGGASLAMDTSHSRPHKVTDISASKAFDIFEGSLKKLLDALESSGQRKIKPNIRLGDARRLPLHGGSIDIVITSPPYLNAIDYLRGHKLSLVWMGYSIPFLRALRSGNIGSQANRSETLSEKLESVLEKVCKRKFIPKKLKPMLVTYLQDLELMMEEIFRVLAPRGTATFVVGNSSVQGVFVKNSQAIIELGKNLGLKLQVARIRKLPANRRYLPPPSKNAGIISNRMRTETVLTFLK